MSERASTVGKVDGMAVQWRCGNCRSVVRPRRTYCPDCGVADRMAPEPLSRTGTLFTWTTVEVGGHSPLGPPPYVLGYVDLTNGLRVLTLVDIPPSQADALLEAGCAIDLELVEGDAGEYLLARPEPLHA